MYKHQVIGARRERSWRSRSSNHIVGLCTLEALDDDERFHDFDDQENWRAEDGKVSDAASNKDLGLKSRCRFWALEEVAAALQQASPKHEFYTRDPKDGAKILVEIQGRWIKTKGDGKHPGNLHSLESSLVPCSRANCSLIPPMARPVFRADGPDC